MAVYHLEGASHIDRSNGGGGWGVVTSESIYVRTIESTMESKKSDILANVLLSLHDLCMHAGVKHGH